MRTRKVNVEIESGAAVDAAALFRSANSEWERGRDEKAFELFLQAALLGDASSQHNIGYFYDAGVGTRKNSKMALFWYKKAWLADKQTGTCTNIAKVYAALRNTRRALFWWRRAVRLGDGDAALDLAKFYLSRGISRDHARSVSLLRKAKASRHVTDDALEEATRLLESLGK